MNSVVFAADNIVGIDVCSTVPLFLSALISS